MKSPRIKDIVYVDVCDECDVISSFYFCTLLFLPLLPMFSKLSKRESHASLDLTILYIFDGYKLKGQNDASF